MTTRTQKPEGKLELNWVNKHKRARPEPRVLVENSSYAYNGHKDGIFDNMLIHGDNLLALKALENDPNVRGKVKCIFIDPPYNTGSAFEHYDDGIEHSLWLTMMRDRLDILHNLLAEDGSIWITLDDNEAHYFKVMADEVFGRSNFVATIIWRKNYAPKSSAKHFSVDHDYAFVYAKNADRWQPNLMPRSEKQDKAYKNPDNDPRGPWRPNNLAARNFYSKGTYSITTPSGRVIEGPPAGSYWRVSREKFDQLDQDGRIWWGKDGSNVPAPKIFLCEVKQGVVPQTYWDYEEVGHTQEAKKEIISLFQSEVFDTPKPERLMQRVIHLASAPGDIVLDSFAGSGTTGAVAHKMGRRWIMVELGEHAKTHIVPRMQKVIDGTDKGGVTEASGWQGGGGYRYYELAPTLLVDQDGRKVINPKYDPEMLAKSICLHKGYDYTPSSELYWKHGTNGHASFLFVTTSKIDFSHAMRLSNAIGEDATLQICCAGYESECENISNLTMSKIPKSILELCEWGRDSYALDISEHPEQEEDECGEDE